MMRRHERKRQLGSTNPPKKAMVVSFQATDERIETESDPEKQLDLANPIQESNGCKKIENREGVTRESCKEVGDTYRNYRNMLPSWLDNDRNSGQRINIHECKGQEEHEEQGKMTPTREYENNTDKAAKGR